MAAKNTSTLTQDRIKELLSYDPETGCFTWLVTRKKGKKGAIAGCVNGSGYVVISIDGTIFAAHRLAFFYTSGLWPENQVDHINGVRSDNKWSNLREATRSENQHNHKLNTNNKSGYPGVSWYSHSKKWHAEIYVDNARVNLGMFSSREDAYQSYLKAKEVLHPFQPIPRVEQ